MGSRHPPRPCPQRWAETTVTEHTLRGREGLSGKTRRQGEKNPPRKETGRREDAPHSSALDQPVVQPAWQQPLFLFAPWQGRAEASPAWASRAVKSAGPAEDLKVLHGVLLGERVAGSFLSP